MQSGWGFDVSKRGKCCGCRERNQMIFYTLDADNEAVDGCHGSLRGGYW
jgi:hypothetical protein